MATTMTASTASGYMTTVQWWNLGPFKVMTAHYSAPASATMVFAPYLNNVALAYMQNADNDTWVTTNTNTAYGVYAQVSGVTTGDVGNVFIMGW